MKLRSGRLFAPDVEEEDNVTDGRSISSVFREMIATFDATRPSELALVAVACRFKLKNRRAYDFFSVLSAISVCSPLKHGVVRWLGISRAEKMFEEVYTQFEVENMTVPFTDWFSMGKSPTLATLTLKIICLFYALGVDTLHIQKISSFFVSDRHQKKSMERRMYLVLSIIEILGYVEHRPRSSCYTLKLPIETAVETAMRMKHEYAIAHMYARSTESLMTKLDLAYITELRKERMELFEQGMPVKVPAKPVKVFPEQMKPAIQPATQPAIQQMGMRPLAFYRSDLK